jgi:hypothetical protein
MFLSQILSSDQSFGDAFTGLHSGLWPAENRMQLFA